MILVIVLIFILSDCVASQSVTCSRNGIEKKIEGIAGLNIFRQYEDQCGDESTVVLKYMKCDIGSIGLNITRIKQHFPKLRTLYWGCKGYCFVIDSNVHVDVIGCEKGKYTIILFIFR